ADIARAVFHRQPPDDQLQQALAQAGIPWSMAADAPATTNSRTPSAPIPSPERNPLPATRLGVDTTHESSVDPIRAALITAYTRTHNVGSAHPTAQALARMSATEFRAAYEQLNRKTREYVTESISNVGKQLPLTIFHEKAIDALAGKLQPQPLDRSGTLTDFQFTELRLAAEDVPTRQIAEELGISERTVRAHLERIQNVLGADDTASAVVAAVRRGILALGDLRHSPASAEQTLTAREHDVLVAIAQGKTSAEAAAGLGIAEDTVNAHLERIGDKLGS